MLNDLHKLLAHTTELPGLYKMVSNCTDDNLIAVPFGKQGLLAG